MKDFEKEIEEIFLSDEEDTLHRIEIVYENATKDVQKKARELSVQMDKQKAHLSDLQDQLKTETDEKTIKKLKQDIEVEKSKIQSKVYQIEYQNRLKKQVDNYLDVIKDKDVSTIEDYLERTYSNGFMTEQYRLMNEGINITMPVNQNLLKEAITFKTEDIPLSDRLYSNVDKAKKEVINEISRGLSTGMSVGDMARNIKEVMNVSTRKSYQIATNESQRVRQRAIQDSMQEAKKKGADIVKMWVSTLDGKTRPHHRELDHKWVEIDEEFKYSGGYVNAPKQFGIASEDINCRCTLKSTPRWDISDTYLRRDNETGEIVEVKNYQDWYDRIYTQSDAYKETQKTET